MSGTVAVIVLSHRDPAQVARLVRRVTTGANTLAVVHHDPTGEPLTLRPSSDVAVIPDPEPCRWGRLSLVRAQWRALGWVRANVPDLSWALLVSGQDYPIRTMRDIENELAVTPAHAYLRHFRADGDPADDVHPWQELTRRRYLHRRRLPFSARSVPLPVARRHPYRDGVRLYVGDMWFNLSGDAVDGMLEATPLSDRLLRYLRHAPIPDECFIASMALNTLSPELVRNDSKRFIRWTPRSKHPQTITAGHRDLLVASDAFFARKLDAAGHPEVPDLLDALAEERSG